MDGSYNQAKGICGYGIVFFDQDNEEPELIFENCQGGRWNASGEIMAAQEAVQKALNYGCESIEISYEIDSTCCECRCVETGKDSVDFAIVKEYTAEDIMVTQDVGLAAMVLPKAKAVISTYGWFYTDRNIDKLLNRKHMSSMQR